MTAPVVPTLERNKLGIAALVLVLISLVLPIVLFVVFSVAASIEGAEGDDLGYAMLGGFFLAFIATAFIAPIPIVGIVLAIIALTRKGKRKVQAVLAIVLGVVPAAAIFGLPAAIDSLF